MSASPGRKPTPPGATQEPKIEHYEATDAVYNDPALAQRLQGVLESALGKDNVVVDEPGMASEDFSYFTAQGVPSFYFSLGGADPAKYAEAKAAGTHLPSNHSLAVCSRRRSRAAYGN